MHHVQLQRGHGQRVTVGSRRESAIVACHSLAANRIDDVDRDAQLLLQMSRDGSRHAVGPATLGPRANQQDGTARIDTFSTTSESRHPHETHQQRQRGNPKTMTAWHRHDGRAGHVSNSHFHAMPPVLRPCWFRNARDVLGRQTFRITDTIH